MPTGLYAHRHSRARPTAPLKQKAPGTVRHRGLLYGVADGARTHDNWNHNPGLYRLSYSHR